MSDNPIDRALGLRPLEEAQRDLEGVEDAEAEDIKDHEDDVEQPSESVPATIDSKTADVIAQAMLEEDETLKDIEQARLNIQNIIEQGDNSLKEMIELAKQSESPRAFEVASNLMKTLLDANKDFVDMSHRKKYHKEELLAPKEEEQEKNNVTNNNLFVGSTTDLLKMLKGEEE